MAYEEKKKRFLSVLRTDYSGRAGNISLRATLNWNEKLYENVKAELIEEGRIERATGKGGSVLIASAKAKKQPDQAAQPKNSPMPDRQRTPANVGLIQLHPTASKPWRSFSVKSSSSPLPDPEMTSADIVAGNIEALKALFPDAFTEGRINFDVLKGLLGSAVDGRDEKYGLNWHGKRRARQIALTPSTGTLLPCPDESVDWDTTQNLMIEGDNLEVLKLLQKSYAGKVKMIYIDPPYNTGSDFVYADSFADNIRNYQMLTGQIDADGRKISSNTESSGRFHTDWLNMIYPRLKLARNLLRQDGIIYVSIDDGEISRLKIVMDDIFGEENFLGMLTRVSKLTSNKGTHFSPACDYVLAYSHFIDGLSELSDPSAQEDEDYVALFRFEDKRGKYNEVSLYMPSLDFRPNQRYFVSCPDGSKAITPEGKVFRWTPETLEKNIADDRVIFKQTKTSPLIDKAGKRAEWNVYTKIYLHERLEKGLRPATLLNDKSFTNSSASKELIKLEVEFPFSKPWQLIAHLSRISGTQSGDIILDFFAGSGSLGHAIMAQNASDSGARRYILVQLPEQLDIEQKNQKPEAEYCDKLGRPRKITELTKERLRRAGAKIKQENALFKGDTGFRVFKLASSNILAWEPDAANLDSSLLKNAQHLVQGRKEQDVLYELLLKRGLDICVPIKDKLIAGKLVHSIGGGALVACLADGLTKDVIEPLSAGIVSWIKELAPAVDVRVVFKDSGFADDIAKTNMAAILSQNGISDVRSL